MRRAGIAAIVLVTIASCRTYDTLYTDDAGTNACVTPRIMCNGTCIDPMTDRLNCNGCNKTCAANELCEQGSCTACPPNNVACGTSGAAFCTNTSVDTRNCGGCDIPCAQGSTCKNGQCICPLTTCGNECVDVQTDANHCGGCTTPCPSPGPHESAICTSGHCGVVCSPPFADCDGQGSNGCESNLLSGATTCGACGRTCANSGACTSGTCPATTYASNKAQLSGVAVDSSFVYWADHTTSGGILRATIAGGTSQTYFTDNVATLLASDATNLVWLHLNTQIESRPLAGGTVTLLTNASGILTMYVANGFVYYGTSSGVVARVPVDGSAQPTTITSVASPQSIVADATNVYVANVVGDVVSAPVSAQNAIAVTLAASASANALAIDATNVYWISVGSGEVVAQSKSSSTKTVLATKQTIVTNLVADGTALFWGATDTSVRELPITGGTPLVLASNEGQITAIAVDATSVYWTSTDHVRSTSK